MEDKRQIWTPYETDQSAHSPADLYPPVTFYNTPWQRQALHQIPHYTNSLPTYDFVPPNVDPFQGFIHRPIPVISHYPYNPDAEVSYYSRVPGYQPGTNFYDENRCSSTDTTLSTSSVSTVHSYSSMDFDDDSSRQQGSKRKRKASLDAKDNKPSKVKNGHPGYRRWPKPPYTYYGLIITAIQLSPRRELTLQEIHASLMELFPFFRGSYKGWRDSVRHNLSHNPIFYKAIRDPPTKAGYWRVDWSRVTPAMFARQQNKLGKSNLYKPTIHEHLGLPPFTSESVVTDDIVPTSNVPETPRQQTKRNRIQQTPEICDTRNFSVTLPSVQKCENQVNSPYQINARENMSFEQMSPAEVRDSALINQVAPPSEKMSASTSFSHVLDLVVSERRSSLDALQHLRTLCPPMLISHYQQLDTDLPPLSSDSDAHSYVPSVINSCENIEDEQIPSEIESPNYISVNPASPDDSFVTSLVSPGASDATPPELSSVPEENKITILSI